MQYSRGRFHQVALALVLVPELALACGMCTDVLMKRENWWVSALGLFRHAQCSKFDLLAFTKRFTSSHSDNVQIDDAWIQRVCG